MKKLVTLFAVLLMATTGFARTGGVVELRPDRVKPKVIPAPFVTPKSFVPLGHPKSLPLAAPEALAYFDPNMIDENGQLVEGMFTFVGIPDTVEQTGGNPPESDGTYFTAQVMERFTSTLSNVYLDSVQVAFVADTVPVRIATFVYQDTLNQNGLNVPNVYAKNGLATIASATIAASAVTPAEEGLTVYMLKFNHKKLDLNEASPNSFYVSLTTRQSTTGNPFFSPPASKNRISVLLDRIIDERDYDPEIDRSYTSRTRVDGQWTSNGPMAGRYGFDTDEDGELDEFLFPNLYMIAYVSDELGAVEDIHLEGDALAQNYPNPFNPSTNIAYSVASNGNVTLKVYNALGNEVASLVDGYKTAGKYEVMFDASELPTGTYYYTLKSGSFTSTKRMVLSK